MRWRSVTIQLREARRTVCRHAEPDRSFVEPSALSDAASSSPRRAGRSQVGSDRAPARERDRVSRDHQLCGSCENPGEKRPTAHAPSDRHFAEATIVIHVRRSVVARILKRCPAQSARPSRRVRAAHAVCVTTEPSARDPSRTRTSCAPATLGSRRTRFESRTAPSSVIVATPPDKRSGFSTTTWTRCRPR